MSNVTLNRENVVLMLGDEDVKIRELKDQAIQFWGVAKGEAKYKNKCFLNDDHGFRSPIVFETIKIGKSSFVIPNQLQRQCHAICLVHEVGSKQSLKNISDQHAMISHWQNIQNKPIFVVSYQHSME